MPEIVEDVQDEAKGNWKGAATYGLATGVGGSAFGPLGHGAGALLAGAYNGGTVGNAMTQIGGGEAIQALIRGGMGGGGAGGSRNKV